MKSENALATVACLLLCTIIVMTAQAGEQITKIAINISPGIYPNAIAADADSVTPVLIFGSESVDVANIDPRSLQLGVNEFWRPSYVKSSNRLKVPLCETRDIGSPDRYYFDGMGPPDGYDDLLCYFTHDMALIQRSIQPLTLTGTIIPDVGGQGVSIYGTDFANVPGTSQAIVRCCIHCDGQGNCGGCNGDIYRCTDFLRVCDGKTICRDCSGCEPPRIS